MVTITLEIPDELFKRFAADAAEAGLTGQELAVLRVLFSAPFGEQGQGMDFESATEYVFQKNSELYARLADRKERVSEAIKRIIDKNEQLYRRLA